MDDGINNVLFKTYNPTFWELFRLNLSDGKFQVHRINKYSDYESPSGDANLYYSSVSKRGIKCQE